MAITNRWLVAAVVAAAVTAIAYYSLREPPQMGPDAGVFHAVDALYTAVRLKDAKHVTDCEKRLHAARAAGTLPAAAAAHLDGIIARTRAGDWDPATRQLYAFMLAQRREGDVPVHHAKGRK